MSFIVNGSGEDEPQSSMGGSSISGFELLPTAPQEEGFPRAAPRFRQTERDSSAFVFCDHERKERAVCRNQWEH